MTLLVALESCLPARMSVGFSGPSCLGPQDERVISQPVNQSEQIGRFEHSHFRSVSYFTLLHDYGASSDSRIADSPFRFPLFIVPAVPTTMSGVC
jgi:hypothetical protein